MGRMIQMIKRFFMGRKAGARRRRRHKKFGPYAVTLFGRFNLSLTAAIVPNPWEFPGQCPQSTKRAPKGGFFVSRLSGPSPDMSPRKLCPLCDRAIVVGSRGQFLHHKKVVRGFDINNKKFWRLDVPVIDREKPKPRQLLDRETMKAIEEKFPR